MLYTDAVTLGALVVTMFGWPVAALYVWSRPDEKAEARRRALHILRPHVPTVRRAFSLDARVSNDMARSLGLK